MNPNFFVGRQDSKKRLIEVLTGKERAIGNLTIQSIEGPGGIGKTFFLNYVLTTTDLSNRKFLTIRIDGNNNAGQSLVRIVARMVDQAEAEEIKGHPSGYYFRSVDKVTKAIDIIRSEALSELSKQHSDNEEIRNALLRFFDFSIEAGKRLNDVSPFTKKYLNVREIEKSRLLIEQIIPLMTTLKEDGAAWYERLGKFSENRTLRNSIKENACCPLADALVSDLSAILREYRSKDLGKATHKKVKGIDRLLLIIDDYEKMQTVLSEFLVSHLLPSLQTANFESTVIILGRDQLEATHAAMDQHYKSNLLKRISLTPFNRSEMDQLVESFGVESQKEKDRAWSDTQGYPFYVQLWTEEAESGGRSAVMLKRFYDRTTRWMNEHEKQWLEYILFLDEVNPRTLRGILENKNEADDAFKWFESEGSVRDTLGEVFKVREYLRSRLVDYIRISNPDRFDELTKKTNTKRKRSEKRI